MRRQHLRAPGADERNEFAMGSIRTLFKVAISGGLLAVLIYQTDPAQLWARGRSASPAWLLVALGLYLVMILVSAWRWGALLSAQRVTLPSVRLVQSYLVATFFNNFLPSNIGGDVIRIKDTVAPTGSRTMAATIVLLDRAIGLLGLLAVGAVGATIAGRSVEGVLPFASPVLWALSILGAAALLALVLAPGVVLRVLHPLRLMRHEWIDKRLQQIVEIFGRFREQPMAVVNALLGAIVVQAILVAFYLAVARSLRIPIPVAHLAVLVPLSFIVQMLPVSLNGLGLREATFTAYFRTLGLPIESALLLSLLATATIMAFSLSGAAVYATRR